jgi:hypothetical protein
MKKQINKWEWYSVKLIFENIISGEPEPNTINKDYTNIYKTYEESIIIVKAQSFDHAYKIAEKRALQNEIEYTNPYGQLVKCKFVEAIDCYLIGDEAICTGVEVYWRLLRVDKNIDKEEFLDKYYPDTMKEDDDVFYNAVLLNKEIIEELNAAND